MYSHAQLFPGLHRCPMMRVLSKIFMFCEFEPCFAKQHDVIKMETLVVLEAWSFTIRCISACLISFSCSVISLNATLSNSKNKDYRQWGLRMQKLNAKKVVYWSKVTSCLQTRLTNPPRESVDHPQVEFMHSDHVCIYLQCFDAHQLLTMCWINASEPQVVCTAVRGCSWQSRGEIRGNVDSLLLSPLIQSSVVFIPSSNTSSFFFHSCIFSSLYLCLWGRSLYPCS